MGYTRKIEQAERALDVAIEMRAKNRRLKEKVELLQSALKTTRELRKADEDFSAERRAILRQRIVVLGREKQTLRDRLDTANRRRLDAACPRCGYLQKGES